MSPTQTPHTPAAHRTGPAAPAQAHGRQATPARAAASHRAGSARTAAPAGSRRTTGEAA
ncbi:hypothetical protein [Streptomyces sp. NPDC002209]|uniref:hypothetical protein n=1 Tax=Streptomyces sp. NPDC002209 TaxID=3364638 RepID=UPI0036A45A33